MKESISTYDVDLYYSKGCRRVLEGHFDTQALRHLGIQALGHSGNEGHLDTETLRTLGHSRHFIEQTLWKPVND